MVPKDGNLLVEIKNKLGKQTWGKGKKHFCYCFREISPIICNNILKLTILNCIFVIYGWLHNWGWGSLQLSSVVRWQKKFWKPLEVKIFNILVTFLMTRSFSNAYISFVVLLSVSNSYLFEVLVVITKIGVETLVYIFLHVQIWLISGSQMMRPERIAVIVLRPVDMKNVQILLINITNWVNSNILKIL